MVAENVHGIGRSLLGDLLSMMWGTYAGRVTLPQLTGCGSQADQSYNDWGKRKLFLVCEEAHEGEKVDFHTGYETQKQYIDTRPTTLRMNTKFGTMGDDTLWFSLLMFTNHADALPLPEDDRRFYVIQNPFERREPEYYCRLAKTLTPDYVAQVWHWLQDRDISGFDPKMPKMTAGKRRMISSTRGPIDTMWMWIVENAAGALVTKHVLGQLVRQAAREVGEQDRLRIAPLNTVADVKREARRVYSDMRRGNIAQADARACKELLRLIADLVTEGDLETRLAKLEAAAKSPRNAPIIKSHLDEIREGLNHA